jgi:hypothetical protein
MQVGNKLAARPTEEQQQLGTVQGQEGQTKQKKRKKERKKMRWERRKEREITNKRKTKGLGEYCHHTTNFDFHHENPQKITTASNTTRERWTLNNEPCDVPSQTLKQTAHWVAAQSI